MSKASRSSLKEIFKGYAHCRLPPLLIDIRLKRKKERKKERKQEKKRERKKGRNEGRKKELKGRKGERRKWRKEESAEDDVEDEVENDLDDVESLEIDPADSDVATDGDEASSGPADEPLGRAKKD